MKEFYAVRMLSPMAMSCNFANLSRPPPELGTETKHGSQHIVRRCKLAVFYLHLSKCSNRVRWNEAFTTSMRNNKRLEKRNERERGEGGRGGGREERKGRNRHSVKITSE